MNVNRKIVIIVAIVVAIVAIIGIARSLQPRDRDPVYVGTILDLTGPAASFGQMQRHGIELALEDIRATPSDVRIEVVYQDSRLDPKLALTAANKLIESDRVVALTSITGSSIALTVAPVANRAHIPIVDSLSSAPALTDEGGPYYFRIQPADDYAGREIVTWARDEGARTAATVYAESDWGQGLRDAIRSAAATSQLSIALEEPMKPSDTEFRALIARIRNVAPDVVFLVAHPKEAGLFLKQAAEAGIRLKIYGSDSLSTEEVRTVAGPALNGVRFVLSSEGSGEALQAFRKRYRARFNADASANSIRAYDAMRLLVEVMRTHGYTPDAITRGLNAVQRYQGISGWIEFDEHGDLRSPLYDRFEYDGVAYNKLQGRTP